MPRQVRIQYPGAIYHVMARGDHREAIYADSEDRSMFLDALGEACGRTGWLVHPNGNSTAVWARPARAEATAAIKRLSNIGFCRSSLRRFWRIAPSCLRNTTTTWPDRQLKTENFWVR